MADKKVRIIITGKDDTKRALRSVAGGFKNVGKSLLGLGAKLTAGITLPIVGIGVAAAKAAIDYESAFAGVIKTTDGLIDAEGNLTASGKELSDGFRDLAKEIPLAASELAGIGEIAGQLGVPKEDILDFTRTIADIAVATNLTVEGAASDFARFANIVGMPMDDIGRLGSTVVELGNNLATTESELVDMAMRIAGVGSVVGLTEPQILGWAGAMSSVGIRAEAGGTAISRVFADIAAAVASGGEDIAGFAETAGLSIDEFSELFEVDASGAMLAFVQGLGEIQDEGGNVLGVLEDLGLDSVRIRDTLLRLAGAGPLVAEALGIANEGWEENTALTKEAEQRYGTTESQLAILKNTLTDLGITFGNLILPILQDLVDFIGPVIESFSEMDEGTQKLILGGGLLLAALGPIVTIAGILAMVIGALVSPVGLVVVGIAALVALFIDSQGGIQGAADALGEVWQRVMDFVAVIGTELQPIIQGFRDIWEIVWPRIQEIVHNVLGDVVPFVVTKLGEMRDFVLNVVSLITTWWQANFPLIQETVETVLNFIVGVWETTWPYIQLILETAWENIKRVVTTAINAVLGIIKTIMLLITGDWEGAWEEIKRVGETIWNGIKTIIETTLNAILGIFGTNLDDMLAAITDKIGDFIEGGKSIVQGIIDGIKAAPGRIKDALLGIVQNAWAAVLDFLGIGSPSQLAIALGENLAGSMAIGFRAGQEGLASTMTGGITGGLGAGMQAGGLAAQAAAKESHDFTFRIGNIIISIPGLGIVESGEISQRVAGGEDIMIDARISYAAASVG